MSSNVGLPTLMYNPYHNIGFPLLNITFLDYFITKVFVKINQAELLVRT